MIQRLNYVLSRDIDSPYGKNSVFFETFVVPPEDFDKIPETKVTDRIKYTFILCKSGVEVFDRYEKEGVEEKQFKVFYEEDDPKKSNFFGTACRVKMGKDAKNFFNRIYSNNQNTTYVTPTESITVSGFDNLVRELADDKKINETLLKGAIYLEIAEQTQLNEAFKKVFSLNNQLADWLRGGIETVETWKFTEENYDYEKYFVLPMYSTYQNKVGTSGFQKQEAKYKPIIPVPISAREYKTMQNASEIASDGFNKLKDFVDYFDEISLAIVSTVVKATPTIADDIFFAVVFYLKNFIEDNIPESIKNIYNKLKSFFKDVLDVISGIGAFIGEKINQEVAKINAFLCGLLNGLISLAQTVIMLLAMITDNLPFLNMEKLSPVELTKHQEKLEFIEDFADLFAENSKEFLSGIKNIFSNGKIWKEISQFTDMLKKKFSELNDYFWAYFVGAIAFELILDAIITYFTGGASLAGKISEKIAQAAGKIGRVSQKSAKLGKAINFSKNIGKKIGNSLADLWKWLKKEFLELVEAIKSGNLAHYLKKKFYELTDDVEGLRKLAFGRWLSKFDKGFFNHLEGEFNTELFIKNLPSGFKYTDEVLVSQGGHRGSGIFNGAIDVEKILDPEGVYSMAHLADDIPFKAKISIKYKDGYLVKNAESSMFPKNWDLKRIQEEIAYVYENTVVKGQGVNPASLGKKFKQYKFKDSSGRFDILIEVDDAGNIMNAYPLL
ncbi:EndoU domain-containing protein [Chryseobacterium sp. AG844]|uniref:EndoU domain-containing protein n=1 Tax=Chryseobacterium sp. AG844 TaxID=2183998 RepID=UPI000D9279E1|nr:EndoU domain-containing protein [Chryseobacterium sp. AG844]PWW29977.1 EndoU nuclease-like protein [Chryseobacterium sp. AG844]